MAHCRATLETELPIDEAFAYLADFSNAREWDPGVKDARRLDAGPVTTGSEFEISFGFLGREVPLRYRLVQADAPGRIVFEGGTETVRSVDTITLEKTGRGTRVRYEAQLSLPGLLYLADLPLHLAFQVIGRQAIAGLEKTLRARAAASAA